MLYTPMLPEAASGSLEPRHVVVPLRMMCPHSELLLGRAHGARPGAARRHGRDRCGDARRPLRAGRRRARLVPAGAADPRSRRARSRLQGPRGRDRAPQPRAAPARGGRRRERPSARRGPPHVRLRRSGLCGRRGARRALGPRPRRAALLPAVPAPKAALGARRRGAEDPARDPDAPRRVRREAAQRARGRDHTSTTLASAGPGTVVSPAGSGSRRTRSCGRPA